jgi:hypothetical protein
MGAGLATWRAAVLPLMEAVRTCLCIILQYQVWPADDTEFYCPCCCLQYAEIDAQQLQVKQRHEPRSAMEAIEADYSAAARAKPGRRPLGFEVCSYMS